MKKRLRKLNIVIVVLVIVAIVVLVGSVFLDTKDNSALAVLVVVIGIAFLATLTILTFYRIYLERKVRIYEYKAQQSNDSMGFINFEMISQLVLCIVSSLLGIAFVIFGVLSDRGVVEQDILSVVRYCFYVCLVLGALLEGYLLKARGKRNRGQ